MNRRVPALRSNSTHLLEFKSILHSIGSRPLQEWEKKVRNGQIKRIPDEHIQNLVLEIIGNNPNTTFVSIPADPKKSLRTKMPLLTLIVKNMRRLFIFEVQVLDDKHIRRRFRVSNYVQSTSLKPFLCTIPLHLDDGWNKLVFNLAEYTRRAYGTRYLETVRMQIHANCRLRRVYFSNRMYTEEELPIDYKLFLPLEKTELKSKALVR